MFWLIGLMVAWLSGSQLCQTIWSPRWQSPFSWRRVPIGVGVVNIAVRRLAPWNGVVLCDGLRLAQGSQVPFVGTIVGSGLGSTCATLRPLSSRDTPASSPACGRHYLRLISPHVTGVYVLRCVLALCPETNLKLCLLLALLLKPVFLNNGVAPSGGRHLVSRPSAVSYRDSSAEYEGQLT